MARSIISIMSWINRHCLLFVLPLLNPYRNSVIAKVSLVSGPFLPDDGRRRSIHLFKWMRETMGIEQ